MAAPLLPDAIIDEVLAAAVECGFVQDQLFASVSQAYRASLPDAVEPSARLFARLHRMNRDGRLVDGSCPLEQCLHTAAQLAHPRTEAAIFERALSALGAGAAAGSPLHVGLPSSLHGGFVGREALLAELDAALRGAGRVALRSADAAPGHVFAHGGGGIGKSRLAIEYAHDHAGDYPGGVFFAVAGERDPSAIWADFGRALTAVQPAFSEGLDQDEAAAALFARWLADPGPGMRLLVLDDVAAGGVEDAVKRWRRAHVAGGRTVWPLPAGTRARVLFTTRLDEIPGASPVRVAGLGEASFDLLIARAGRRPRTAEDEAAAQDLARVVLGGHALAIALAGAFLREEPGLSFAAYAREIGEAGVVSALLQAAEVAGYRVEGHETSIVATYGLSRSRLDPAKEADARALRLLELASCVAPNVPIDMGLAKRLLAADGDTAGERGAARATRRLLGLSLVSPASEEEGAAEVTIHPLVAAYTRWAMGEKEEERALGAVVDAAGRLLPGSVEEYWRVAQPGAHPAWEWLSPARAAHALEAWAGSGRLVTAGRGSLGIALGDMYMARGDGTRALALYREALALAERLAAQDPTNVWPQRDLSISHDRIGDVLLNQGDRAGALDASRKGMALRERLAAQDPTNVWPQRDLSISHDKIGDVLLAQGDQAAALDAYRKSMAIRELLAAQDPTNAGWQRSLSASHTRIGDVLLRQGDQAGALDAYRKFMVLAERLAAQDLTNAVWQRDLSVSHERIGDVRRNQGDQAAALDAYRKSMAIRERLAAQDPMNAGWQADLAYLCLCVAGALDASTPARHAETLALLERARGLLAPLAAASRLTHDQKTWLAIVEKRLNQRARAPSR